MTKQVFLSEMKHRSGLVLPNGFILFRRKWELWNSKTDKSIFGMNLDAILDQNIGDQTVGEFIESSDLSVFNLVLDTEVFASILKLCDHYSGSTEAF